MEREGVRGEFAEPTVAGTAIVTAMHVPDVLTVARRNGFQMHVESPADVAADDLEADVLVWVRLALLKIVVPILNLLVEHDEGLAFRVPRRGHASVGAVPVIGTIDVDLESCHVWQTWEPSKNFPRKEREGEVSLGGLLFHEHEPSKLPFYPDDH